MSDLLDLEEPQRIDMRNKTENSDRIVGGLAQIERLKGEVNRLGDGAAEYDSFRRTGYVARVTWRDTDGEPSWHEREFKELRLAVHWRDLRLNEIEDEGKKRLSWTITETMTRGVDDEGKPRNLISFSYTSIGTTITD